MKKKSSDGPVRKEKGHCEGARPPTKTTPRPRPHKTPPPGTFAEQKKSTAKEKHRDKQTKKKEAEHATIYRQKRGYTPRPIRELRTSEKKNRATAATASNDDNNNNHHYFAHQCACAIPDFLSFFLFPLFPLWWRSLVVGLGACRTRSVPPRDRARRRRLSTLLTPPFLSFFPRLFLPSHLLLL